MSETGLAERTSRELPTGTLTFLFTDIEGSTRLVDELGDQFRAVLEDHHSLVRAAIGRHGGQQARIEGDSFFVVFTSAAQAVEAAVEAQQALFAHDWGESPIRVRIGLHTGEAALGGGDYVGIDVHRAARIASAAHGGQVLISATTQALVQHKLPAGVQLRDLGDHRLKDLSAPERLYQLVIADLRSDFPPLRGLDAVANNLPTQLTSFVGRDRELAECVRLLATTRLLTLTGPGGTGKTRLSLRLAAEVNDEFQDGAFFVPLASIGDPQLVPSTIAQTLGLQEIGSRPPRERLLEHLSDRRLLLVLDNFEQILPAAPFVGELLKSAAALKVIVTSRAPLHVSGEHEFQVPPLGLPDPRALPPDLQSLSQYEAVALFIERATAVKPDFNVTRDNAPAIAEICVRLDGLPLAIELAAARVKLLPPEAMLRRLERRLALSASGPRDVPLRQQTLRGAIAWSYDMLDESARRLFARFGVFVGGASLEGAEMVCGPADELGTDVLDGLAGLVDHSLLVQHEQAGEPRFSMLETIREFALERLAEMGEEDDIRARHAKAFVVLAEQAAPELTGPNQKAWLDALEREHDNLRAALDWAVATNRAETAMRLTWALWRFWQMRGHLQEARQRTTRVLTLPGAAEHPLLLARAYEAAASIAYWQGDTRQVEFYGEALRISREVGDKALIANALYNAGFPYLWEASGRVDTEQIAYAQSLFNESLALYRELGEPAGIGKALWGLGLALVSAKDWQAARRVFEESLQIFRDLDDRFHLGWALHEVGSVSVRLGELAKARAMLEEGIKIFADARDISGVVLLLDDMSDLAAAEGRHLTAIRLAAAAAKLQAVTGTNLADRSNEISGRVRPGANLADEEAAAWAEGQAMDADQAVACALSRSESAHQVVG